MSVPCMCPRPTAQLEKALDQLTEHERNTVITPETRQHRAYLERQLALAQRDPSLGPANCPICGGVRE